MKKILFVINPVSGIGRQKIAEKLIGKKLDRSRFEFEVGYTKAPRHATELARDAARRKFDIVVAIGGDGTVNEIGRGLVGTDTAMAILPAGSGNGLARHLKIPMDLGKAMQVIQGERMIRMDTATVNKEAFISIAGVGLDSHIGWEFAKFGKRGFMSYVKVFLREYPKYRPQEFELVLDGKELKRKALLISFANGSQWGNNAVIAPAADLQDGLLEVCVLKDFPLYAVPHLTYRLFNRIMHRSKYLETYRAKEITVKQHHRTAHLDGEPTEIGSELNIKVNPLSLKIITP